MFFLFALIISSFPVFGQESPILAEGTSAVLVGSKTYLGLRREVTVTYRVNKVDLKSQSVFGTITTVVKKSSTQTGFTIVEKEEWGYNDVLGFPSEVELEFYCADQRGSYDKAISVKAGIFAGCLIIGTSEDEGTVSYVEGNVPFQKLSFKTSDGVNSVDLQLLKYTWTSIK